MAESGGNEGVEPSAGIRRDCWTTEFGEDKRSQGGAGADPSLTVVGNVKSNWGQIPVGCSSGCVGTEEVRTNGE